MMRKEEILTLRDRVLKGIAPGLAKKHLPALQPDSRLHPQDLDGELFWIDRLTVAKKWPHVGQFGSGSYLPGLRYEVWYFQKRETALLALLCENRPPLSELAEQLSPVFAGFVEDGRYASRYRRVGERDDDAAIFLKVGPLSRGIWRAAPQSEAKLIKALETLIVDTMPRVEKVVSAIDPNGELPLEYVDSVEQRDPLEELKARFNR